MVRLKDKSHPATFHFAVTLDLADHEKFGLDLRENITPQILVGHFAALELQGELNLISLFQKFPGVIDFNHQVMLADLHGLQLQFLELAGLGAGAGFIDLFLLLVAPFAVIEDFANRRACGRGDFDKIKPGFPSHTQGVRCPGAADFFVSLVDQKNRGNANLLVVAKIRRNISTPKTTSAAGGLVTGSRHERFTRNSASESRINSETPANHRCGCESRSEPNSRQATLRLVKVALAVEEEHAEILAAIIENLRNLNGALAG